MAVNSDQATGLRIVLEEMWKEIPSDLQRYFTESVLDEVFSTLQNPLTLRIAKLLHEVQLLREEELYKKRAELVRKIKQRMGSLKEAHQGRRELQAKAGLSLEDLEKELAADWKMMEDESKSELNQTDLSIIKDIDSIVAEQQEALQGVGVPFFKKTQNATELRIQMTLIDILRRITEMPQFFQPW